MPEHIDLGVIIIYQNSFGCDLVVKCILQMSQVDISSLGLSNQDWLTYTHTNLTSDLDGEPTFFHIPSPSLGNLLEIVPVHLLVAPLLRGKESTPSRAVGLQRGTAFFASFLPLLLWF